MRESTKMLRKVGCPEFLPDIGDYVVITNNSVSHDIPIGTILKVEALAGFGNAVVVDGKHSPKLKNMPDGMTMWVAHPDYAVLHDYKGREG